MRDSRGPVNSERRIVLVVDDETLVRDTVARALRNPGYSVVCVPCVEQSVARLKGSVPAAIVLDLDLGFATSGVAAAALCQRLYPKSPIVVYTGTGTHQDALKCGHVDVVGWVLKGRPLEELEFAVGQAILNARPPNRSSRPPRRGAKINLELHAQLLQSKAKIVARETGLTKAHVEVLWRLLAGASNKDIATATGESESTVERLVSEIFHAIGAENRASACTIAACWNDVKPRVA